MHSIRFMDEALRFFLKTSLNLNHLLSDHLYEKRLNHSSGGLESAGNSQEMNRREALMIRESKRL